MNLKGDSMKMPASISSLLRDGVSRGVYPGAVLLVWQKDFGLASEAVGRACMEPEVVNMEEDTIFDLASLTKPLVTTLVIMKLVDRGELRLDFPLDELLDREVPDEKRNITLRNLLSHSAGFPHWRPFYEMFPLLNGGQMKEEARNWLIYSCPLEHEPGSRSLYSDLGYMILEWVVEQRTGQDLSACFGEQFSGPLGLHSLFLYRRDAPLGYPEERFAATERVNRQPADVSGIQGAGWQKRVLRGEVHDENAFVMGGYSGHAGLFGTAFEVFRVAHLLMEHYLGERDDWFRPEIVREFFSRTSIKGSTWALGWDTPSERNSSAGRYFSRKSVGHLGFTGVSIWMDLERLLMVILLTNRVHPSRENRAIRDFRPRLHDLVVEEVMGR